jgi:hypothetical protein
MPVERSNSPPPLSTHHARNEPARTSAAAQPAPSTSAGPGVPAEPLVCGLPRAPMRRRAPSWPADDSARSRAAIARCNLYVWAMTGEASQLPQRRMAVDCVLRCLDEAGPSGVLDLSGLKLGELPPYVGALSHLRSLRLAGNGLGESPDLRTFPHLRSLSLESDNLATAPDLSAQAALTRLNLGNNRIGIPPALWQCQSLQQALFEGNHLVAMPDVRGLSQLKELDLAHNRLRTVPSWIGQLPAELSIDLRGNPLTAGTIALLEQLSEAGIGPTILFPKECSESDTPASLAEQIDFWLRSQSDTSRTPLSLQAEWKLFEGEPDAGNFALLLQQLLITEDFQASDETRHALLLQVPGVLHTLARDEVLRARCFELAEDGVGSCEDRVALAFGKIGTEVLASRLIGDSSQLLALARDQFRLAHLDEIALRDSKALKGSTEDVEVVLAYRRHYAPYLELPCQPQEMRYAHLIDFDFDRLMQAVDEVNKAGAIPGALEKFTAALPFWRASLDRHAPCAQTVEYLREVLLEQLGALEDERLAPDSTLTSGAYLARQKEINASHEEKINALYERFTSDFMDALSVPAGPEARTT